MGKKKQISSWAAEEVRQIASEFNNAGEQILHIKMSRPSKIQERDQLRAPEGWSRIRVCCSLPAIGRGQVERLPLWSPSFMFRIRPRYGDVASGPESYFLDFQEGQNVATMHAAGLELIRGPAKSRVRLGPGPCYWHLDREIPLRCSSVADRRSGPASGMYPKTAGTAERHQNRLPAATGTRYD
jgi:hypothetical protein